MKSLFLIPFLLLVLFVPVNAEEEEIEPKIITWTDQNKYIYGSEILLKGHVLPISDGKIQIIIKDPNDLVVLDKQITLNENGSFQYTINTTGLQWVKNGSYSITSTDFKNNKEHIVKVTILGGIEAENSYTIPETIYQRFVSPISITIDQSEYFYDEKIIVSGTIRDIYGNTRVDIKIIGPDTHLKSLHSTHVQSDKSYKIIFPLTGKMMRDTGNYIITAQYGDDDKSSSTTFKFDASNADPLPEISSLNEEDRIRFQMYIDRWDLFSKDLHRDAERQEYLGNFLESDNIRNRAFVYEALIDYLKLLTS